MNFGFLIKNLMRRNVQYSIERTGSFRARIGENWSGRPIGRNTNPRLTVPKLYESTPDFDVIAYFLAATAYTHFFKVWW